MILVTLKGLDLIRFEFAEPLEVDRTPEQHLRWVLADYPARKLELWRVPPVPGNGVLLKLMSEGLMSGAPFDPVPIIRALGDYGDSGFSPLLLQTFLDDPRKDVRLASIRALGQMLHEGSVKKLQLRLADPDPDISHEALVALCKRTDDASLTETERLAPADPEAPRLLRAGRARAWAMREQDLGHYVEVTLDTPELRADLPALALPIRTELRAVLADERRPDELRTEIASTLGCRFDAGPSLVRLGLAVLSSPRASLELRLAVIWMLGRGGRQNRQAVPALCELLDSPEPGVSDAAAEALGRLGDLAAFGPLLNAHDRSANHESVRLALRRLARPLPEAEYSDFAEGRSMPELIDSYLLREHTLDSPAPAAALVPLLASESVRARREAAYLLGLLGTSQEAPALLELRRREPDELTHAVVVRAAFLAHSRA
jgi:HEAT repeat protein